MFGFLTPARHLNTNFSPFEIDSTKEALFSIPLLKTAFLYSVSGPLNLAFKNPSICERIAISANSLPVPNSGRVTNSNLSILSFGPEEVKSTYGFQPCNYVGSGICIICISVYFSIINFEYIYCTPHY